MRGVDIIERMLRINRGLYTVPYQQRDAEVTTERIERRLKIRKPSLDALVAIPLFDTLSMSLRKTSSRLADAMCHAD